MSKQMYLSGNSINNLLSYCGLVDAKIRASDNHLPIHNSFLQVFIKFIEIVQIENQLKYNFTQCLASSCVGSPMLSKDFQLVVLAVINLTLVPVNLNLNEGPILPSSVTIGSNTF